MSNRIEINIAVLGKNESGKETFAKMLFMENVQKIRVDPLSNLSEIYLEIDNVNFQNSSKKIMDLCKKHNNILMRQNEITSVTDLRDKNIHPFIYHNTNRIYDLINYNNQDKYLNKNIFLTFYLIGNNYLEFKEEIRKANIIIYLTDLDNPIQENDEMLEFLIQIIKEPGNKKYLLPLINKCDDLNMNGRHKDFQRDIINDISDMLKKKEESEYILSPIPISSKYGTIYRQIAHGLNIDISDDEKDWISSTFNISNKNTSKYIIRDIQKNSAKYFKQCGWTAFRNSLVTILNTKAELMIECNFNDDVTEVNKLSIDDETLGKQLDCLNKKAEKIQKIFKVNYSNIIQKLVLNILEKISEMDEPVIDTINSIYEIYHNNKVIASHVKSLKKAVNSKLITNMTRKLYQDEITNDNFSPSKVYDIFKKICDVQISKIDMKKLVVHLCELYSYKPKKLLSVDNLEWLYNCYFDDNEIIKLADMFLRVEHEIDQLHIEQFEMYLLQIVLTKLTLAEKCISCNFGWERILPYCLALRKYITKSLLNESYYKTSNKYDYLFSLIVECCTNIILKSDSTKILYMEYHDIISIINFDLNKIIYFDKFIIDKLTRNYALLTFPNRQCSSDDNSNSESTNDNETSDFIFTDKDMQSDDEKSNVKCSKYSPKRKNS